MATATRPEPERLLNMALGKPGGRNERGKGLARQLHANGYTEDEAGEVMRQWVGLVGGEGNGAYTDREAIATLRAEYRRPALDPWKAAGTSSPGDWKARRLRQVFPTAPPARKVSEPDPESVAGFKRQRAACLLIADTPAEEYLIGRGIPADLVRAAECAYSPAWGKIGPAAVFLIRNEQGKTIAANGRAITPRPEGEKTKQTFGPMAGGAFWTPGALDADPVAVTEAPIDALTLHLAGLPAIATCGTCNLAPWIKDRLARAVYPGHSRTVYTAHDNDPGGEQAAARIGANLALVQVRRLRPELKDWNAMLAGGLDTLREYLQGLGVCDHAGQEAAEQVENRPSPELDELAEDGPAECESCGETPGDWPSDLEPLAESNPSAVFSAVTATIARVDAYGDRVSLATSITAALSDRPQPIRITPGVTIGNLALFALAAARDILSDSPTLRGPAIERLGALGIAPDGATLPGV